VLHVRNFAAEAVEIAITLSFRAEFEDVYAVRGLCAERPGTLCSSRWEGDRLRFRYEGADEIARTTDIRFWRHPDVAEEREARFVLHLAPETEEDITLSITLTEQRPGETELEAAPVWAAPSSASRSRGRTEGALRSVFYRTTDRSTCG
jgi:glycogen debranching enzyme